jgi:hypothetical protein
MAHEKLNFEQLLEAVDVNYQAFIQDLHNYLMDNGCKVTVEEKKSGFFASYKHGKPKKSIVNLLFRKKALFVRIYGENAGKYLDFLNTLPEEMVRSIENASVCKRLVHNTCSPTCSGYDVTIGSERFQKCRYGGFEFLVTNESNPYIKSFVENETKERVAV